MLRKHAPGKFLQLGLLLAALLLNSLISQENLLNIHPYYQGVLRGVSGFTAGSLLCDLVYERTTPWLPPVAESLLAVALLVTIPVMRLHMTLPFLFAALISVTYSEHSRLARFLSLRVFSFLGVISYSIYIWHSPVLKASMILFKVRKMGANAIDLTLPSAQLLIYVLGTIAAVLSLSTLSYFGFENPVRRAFRHRGSPRPS